MQALDHVMKALSRIKENFLNEPYSKSAEIFQSSLYIDWNLLRGKLSL